MTDRSWVSADDLVRAMGGRDHPPYAPQEPRARLSDAEVRARREQAQQRDWSKVTGEEEEPPKPRVVRRKPHFRRR